MDSFDLLVIGGGINGAAIARDAAVREAKVLLVEKDDLASHTSSASSKLIHGGLRYLEYYEFRLVREALQEREILLRTAPHIVRPLRFVLPQTQGMRPWWLLRAGLLLYDLLALRGSLSWARSVGRNESALREPLKDGSARRLLSYWDAWVDDARLVVLNAMDAAERGAEIATRTKFVSARREGEYWHALLADGRQVRAKAIVNAAGPWVADVLKRQLREGSASKIRLIKGSHIVVPRLSEGDHAYILQQPDGRVVFAIPYGDFTLVGTTDIQVAAPGDACISPEEVRYLCDAANRYFVRQTEPDDLVWSYSGVRALHDDGAAEAKAVTRDYHLELDQDPGAKLLSVFGGKITTARALAEEALDMLDMEGRRSTRVAPLPGGDLTPPFLAYLDQLRDGLDPALVERLGRAYGTRLRDLLGDAATRSDLGRHFGAGLYEREVNYLVEHEIARSAEDILWRRTKLGLAMTETEQKRLADYLGDQGPSCNGSVPGAGTSSI
ncbi:glycerol-3-phosphate dehydrogenase [Sphingosinicella rhizophila]|uniref:Glycerol-3-phosphate dehydrogenase n=1 Tax=Sphingosinicella rhizophila TaxID=3050082 RepID=A0ABU3Q1V1_9SPHN|nr:glycerol-3-phosphate dehydrogenase [Sphingosinicella sp. GR2756]MDT9597405.1 glycerol-3-phosphate dehydrogenase [Sphingosinicella sp. GR2756]